MKMRIFLIILLCSPLSWKTFFSGGEIQEDFFMQIDQGYTQFQDTLLEQKLSQNPELISQLNEYAKIKGVTSDIFDSQDNSPYDKIQKIGENDKNSRFWTTTLLKDEVLGNRESWYTISVDNFAEVNTYMVIVRSFYNDVIKKQSEKQAEEIYRLHSIEMFSDGDLENSPFDLMADIEDINHILFGESGEYDIFGISDNSPGSSQMQDFEGDDNYNFDLQTLYSRDFNEIFGSNENETLPLPFPVEEEHIIPTIDDTTGVCFLDQTGLNQENLDNLIFGITDISEIIDEESENSEDSENTENEQGSTNNQKNTQETASDWGHSPFRNDPKCSITDFFCINIEFEEYNQPYKGNREDPSISYIIARSNEYFEPAAQGSLAQANMATNNFELNLNDVSFVDNFDMNIFINRVPFALLKTDDNNDDSTHSFNTDAVEKDRILETAFSEKGLSYEKQNDILAFERTSAEHFILSRARGRTKSEISQLTEDFVNHNAQKENTQELLDIQIENFTKEQGSFQNFLRDFDENTSFLMQIGSKYPRDLYMLLDKMLKIPQW